MVKQKKTKEGIDVIMPNGKYYSDGFDDFMSLMSLRSKRFHSLHIPNDFKFSIMEHTAICGLLVSKYCHFMANDFSDESNQFSATYNNPLFIKAIYQAVLCHDIEECIIGDIPSPVKFESLEDHKKLLRENIMNFLQINTDIFGGINNVLHAAVKHIDVVAAFIELFSYKNVLDIGQQKNIFIYYASKIDEYKIEKFVKSLSSDLYDFYIEYLMMANKVDSNG